MRPNKLATKRAVESQKFSDKSVEQRKSDGKTRHKEKQRGHKSAMGVARPPNRYLIGMPAFVENSREHEQRAVDTPWARFTKHGAIPCPTREAENPPEHDAEMAY